MVTPRRKELERQINDCISIGIIGDENIGAELLLSGDYIKSLRYAAGIKFPKVKKEKKQVRKQSYCDWL